ncbi:unnamed protein product [Rotaria sordida]|uniref:RING-type domain-containing protein n=2 Tax=Rotaria sordida TaxID=392033 RepID=A0A819RFV3_9BILA|nr:unnamed protein product [Rotaria sordida]CAF1142634.1 unnamed protein product [Rotaria sordida]CAF4046443.1 unnamed protein product [Rotaria sordida]
MSIQVDSTIVTAPTEKDKKKTICGACTSDLEPDDSGIQCVQGHYFCTQCSTNIVRLFFSEPHNYIPLRCLICRIELNPSVFERQLTPEQIEFYDQHMLIFAWSKHFLDEDERLDHCPFCSFAAIRNINASHIFHCQHEQCLKVSCLICRKVCPKFQSDYGTDEELAEMDKHFKCAELADDKHIVDEYLESGQKIACPKCGLAGMKDDACTHMTCPTCAQLWCYFCGKKVEDCEKARDGTNGIFDHNHNWDCNPNRCPMYLTQVCDIDDRWPDDEEQCLVMFHRNRSLRLLREVYEKLGKERIDELDRHFNIISTCGFTMEEIFDEDLTLIKYPDNIDTRRDD